MAIFEHRDFTR